MARWLVVATVTLGALGGGAIVFATAERQYDATARVMLNVTAPDPITGSRLNKRTIDPYLASQLNFIREFQVVGPAAQALGWFEDPDIQAAYNARPARDQRPFPIWVAQSISDALQTSLVEGSNIVAIRYRGSSPEQAALVAGAVRDAYIAASIGQRRDSAMADADSQASQAERLRTELSALQAQKVALERATGVLLAASGRDVDGDRLLALAAPLTDVPPAPIVTRPGTLSGQLAQLDVELVQASRVLGPNHPRLVELRTMRNVLAVRADAEAKSAGGAAAAVIANERAKAAAFEGQKAIVLSQRQNVLRIRILQDQINLKARALDQALKRIASLRQLSTSTESGLTPVGDVENEPGVAYPNAILILGGTGGLGLLAGILTALLIEMFNLRVRTVGGLKIAAPVPVLGVVPAVRGLTAAGRQRRPFKLRLGRLKPATV